jgi:hypothetical protein
VQSDAGAHHLVGGGTLGSCGEENKEIRLRDDVQPGLRAFRVTKRPRAAESAERKAALRQGMQERECLGAREGQDGQRENPSRPLSYQDAFRILLLIKVIANECEAISIG